MGSQPDVLARLRSALADRYTIERELGRGGMATVYLARDLRQDRAVAMADPPVVTPPPEAPAT